MFPPYKNLYGLKKKKLRYLFRGAVDPQYIFARDLKRAHEKGGVEAALQVWNTLGESQTDPILITRMGGYLRQSNRIAEAIALFEQHVELQPNDVQAIETLGIMYEKTNQPDKAIELYKAILNIAPEDTIALNSLGNLRTQQGAFEKAEDYLTRSLALDSKNTVTLTSLGNLKLQQGVFEKADRYLTRSLALDSENTVTLNSLGNLKSQQKKYQEGKKYFERSLCIDHENAPAHYGIAKIHYISESPEACRQYMIDRIQKETVTFPEIILFFACRLEKEPLLPAFKQYISEDGMTHILNLAERFQDNPETSDLEWGSNRIWNSDLLFRPVNAQALLQMAGVPDPIKSATHATVSRRKDFG